MGSDSKYKDDVSCGLVDFGYFSPNVCLGHCCPSRVKHISDRVSTEVVGWPELPDPERYGVIHDGDDPQPAGEEKSALMFLTMRNAGDLRDASGAVDFHVNTLPYAPKLPRVNRTIEAIAANQVSFPQRSAV